MDWNKYISEHEIKSFILKQYSLAVVETKLLEGYEDYNLQIRAHSAEATNGNTTTGSEKVYVFKISHPSTDVHTLELQNQLLLHLSRHGIETCVPQMSSQGLYTEQLFSSKDSKTIFLTRLLHYLHGVTFEACGRPLYLLHSIGEFVGKICNVLQKFRFKNYKQTTSLFELSKAPEIEEHIRMNYHGDDMEMALQILNEYKTRVQPALHRLQTGFIHGDINARNIILKPPTDDNSSSDYVIEGVIDLGDACKSFYIYEISVIMADMMSACLNSVNPIAVGKRILAGVRENFTMTELELSLLKLCICVRLLQVHVLIEDIIRKHQMQTDTEYFERCRVSYLEVCKIMWQTSDQAFADGVIIGKLIE